MTIVIRSFREGDRERVIDLVRELQANERRLFDRMRDPADLGAAYLEAQESACSVDGGRILVAERDGAVLAYACVLTGLSSEGEPDEVLYRYALVQDLVVTASARRQGLGSRLLAACEDVARAAGLRWLRITHLADNRAAALAYERFGFRNLFVDMEKPLD